jgi:hypothetical protein
MPELLLALPDYYIEVARRLHAADWMVHNFRDADAPSLYNPANYLYNNEFEDTKFVANIDLNVLQYIVNCVKKPNQNPSYQDACALLLFCRYANILIEPSLALYERINHGRGNVEEALDDLTILRALDNLDPDRLAQYMLGNPLALEAVDLPVLDRAGIRDGLTRFERLTDWDSVYVLVLGAVCTFLDGNVQPANKFEYYLNWMIREFRLSLACIVYAIRLFGRMPLPKMMKYSESLSPSDRRKALCNMTWDLFLVNQYLKNWADPRKTREEVFFTQDKVVKELLRMAISVQYAEGVEPLLRYLRVSEALRCRELIDSANSRDGRVYRTSVWSPSYRDSLILKLESGLGLSSEKA